MKCLIIAAGKGRRFLNKYPVKPLIPLLGLPILERVILTALKAGVDDFYIVTGYRSKEIGLFLDGLAQRRRIKITHLINEDWDKEENASSVFKAQGYLREKFILLMSDHLFDYSILDELKEKSINSEEIILAVDYRIKENNLVNTRDVTKVLTKDSCILQIGKDLENYNCYDTGIFLCTPIIFKAIEETLKKNNSSLSAAIKILADSKKAKVFDIKERFWIDIDDEHTLKKAEYSLLYSLKKSTDGPIARYFNRAFSIRLTKCLLKTPISANLVSVTSFILCIMASFLFSLKGYRNLLTGAILAQIASIIDGSDGEIARLRFQETEFGGWFDAVLDRYADAFLLFGLTYHGYLQNNNLAVLLVGFLAIIGSFVNSYTADKYDSLMKRYLSLGKHYFRIGRDIRIFIIFIGAVFNLVFLTLGVIALLMNLENLRRIFLFYKKYAKV